MSSPTAQGKAFERRVREHLARRGWAVRSSLMSRGSWDLRATAGTTTLLVQVKRGSYMAPAAHNALWDDAQRDGAVAVLAGRTGRALAFWRLTGPKPGLRGARQPLLLFVPDVPPAVSNTGGDAIAPIPSPPGAARRRNR